MNIAVIGAGHVGGALATQFAKVGHSVKLGVRDPQESKVQELVSKGITAHTVQEAVVDASDIIVLAIPAKAGYEVAQTLGNLSSKVVIDATNAVFGKPQKYATVADAILDICKAKDIVKCFNTTGFANMADPDFKGTKIDMFMAGNSKKAKEIASKLAKEIGFGEVYDLGGNENFGLIEQLALVWVTLVQQGNGRDIAFKILKR